MDSNSPLTRPEDCPPVHTQSDLQRHWAMLMGDLGFGTRSLWLHLLDDDGRPTPVLVQIEDLPPFPGEEDIDRIFDVCRHFVPEPPSTATLVFLLTRPGGRGIVDGERAWARALQDAVGRAGLPVWPVHCANDLELVACTPDDLAATGTGSP